MAEESSQNNIRTINYKDIIFQIKSKIIVYLLIICLSVGISLLYSLFIAVPKYDSTAKIYIMNKQSQNISSNDLSVSTFLTHDYEELIVDSPVLSEVSQRLNNKYSYNYIKKAIILNNPENTRIIEITVRTDGAYKSKEIADQICLVSQEKIVELLGIDRVSIIRNGNVSSKPASPNITTNIFKSLLFGVAISVILVILFIILDDKIKNQEDVEKYLNINTLGLIPFNKT